MGTEDQYGASYIQRIIDTTATEVRPEPEAAPEVDEDGNKAYEPSAIGLLTWAQEIKEYNDWRDFDAMLVLQHENGSSSLVVLDIPVNGMLLALAVMEAGASCIAQKGGSEIVMAGIVADSYVETTPKGEDRKHPDMASDWAAGNRENISECITILMTKSDGSIEQLTKPYNAEERTWGEAWDPAEGVAGPLVEALKVMATTRLNDTGDDLISAISDDGASYVFYDEDEDGPDDEDNSEEED